MKRPDSRLRSLPVLIFLLTSFLSPGQDLKYARSVVDTLASPSMHGRGYVNNGDKIAASYIANEFKKLGLQMPGRSYTQEFKMNVNTFTGRMKLAVDGTALKPGADFIISPESKGASLQNCKVVWVDSSIITDKKSLAKFHKAKLQGKALVIDERSKVYGKRIDSVITTRMRESQGKFPAAMIYVKDKLTWSVSQDENPAWISFDVLKGAITGKTKKISFDVESSLIKDYTTQNIAGFITGAQYPDSFIVFSAHYDHLGVMGKDANGKDVYFPGANDNASGMSMLLSLAKYFSEHKPKYSIAFMAFGAEEAGLVGSRYYTEHPLFPLGQVKFLINIDLAGTGDEGITVVNGSIHQTEFKALQVLNAQGSYLKDVKVRGKAANSDHYYFSEKGVKAFFIYTMGGIKAYHDIYDRPETLPLTEFEDLFLLLRDFEEHLEHVK